jgi:hypothetical protein
MDEQTHDTTNTLPEVTLGGAPLIATDQVREDGARLYTWPNGMPALYLMHAPSNPEPCFVCGLYDGEMLDTPWVPDGVTIHRDCFSRLWEALWSRTPETVGDMKARIGREVRQERIPS